MTQAPTSPSPDAAQDRLDDSLFAALDRRDLPGLKTALAQGADPNALRRRCATAEFGFTPLTWPHHRHFPAALAVLLAAGADPNRRDILGLTPLAAALMRRDVAGYAALMRAGADPLAPIDRARNTVLHAAARRGGSPDYIYAARAFNLNARNEGGATPLMLAVETGNLPLARELLRRGADMDIRDGKGRTPLMAATAQNSREMIALLQDEKKQRGEARLLARVQELEEEMYDLKKLLQVSGARRPPPGAPRPKK